MSNEKAKKFKKNLGRPKQGKETKEHTAIRIEPIKKRKLIKAFGTFSTGFNYLLKAWEEGRIID